MEQRFVVNGINNDKIELMSKYDVRKLNRLLDAKDKMWLVKIKKTREEIANKYDDPAMSWEERDYGRNEMIDEVLEILDRLIESESE